MYRGLYTATTGLLTQEIQMDLITNNLANVNTNGYKQNASAIKSFPQVLVHRINDTYLKTTGIEGQMDVRPMVGLSTFGAVIDEISIDFQKGSFIKTDSKFDMAIDGPGFFVVQTPFGERMTRDGQFNMNANNELVNMEGYRVMGEGGPIILDGNNFIVNDEGYVFIGDLANPQLLDRLKVVTVDDTKTIKKVGHNLYTTPQGVPQPYSMTDAKVKQGVLERSNVNAITMMRNMIDIFRTYEANSRVISTEDQLMSRSINDIPRVGG